MSSTKDRKVRKKTQGQICKQVQASFRIIGQNCVGEKLLRKRPVCCSIARTSLVQLFRLTDTHRYHAVFGALSALVCSELATLCRECARRHWQQRVTRRWRPWGLEVLMVVLCCAPWSPTRPCTIPWSLSERSTGAASVVLSIHAALTTACCLEPKARRYHRAGASSLGMNQV